MAKSGRKSGAADIGDFGGACGPLFLYPIPVEIFPPHCSGRFGRDFAIPSGIGVNGFLTILRGANEV
jgi:hypothetical protein